MRIGRYAPARLIVSSIVMFFIGHRDSILNPVINLPITCNCFEIAMVQTVSTAVLFGYLALH